MLRQVCKDWKQRVDRRLAAHVTLETISVHISSGEDEVFELTSARPPHLLLFVSPTPLQHALETGRNPLEYLQDRMRQAIRTVDLPWGICYDYDHLQFIDAFPKINTVRFESGTLLRNVERMPHVERVVISNPVDRPQRHGLSPTACGAADCRRTHTRKLVINLSEPGWLLKQSGPLFSNLRLDEVILILHPWTVHPGLFGAMDPRTNAAVLAAQAVNSGFKITVVNVKHVHLRTAIRVGTFPPNRRRAVAEFTDLVRVTLATRYPGSIRDGWDEHLQFLTAQEYADTVGWREYEIETGLDQKSRAD